MSHMWTSLSLSSLAIPCLINDRKCHTCLRKLCSALKTLKSKLHSLTHSLNEWQCHLLSCPELLKNIYHGVNKSTLIYSIFIQLNQSANKVNRKSYNNFVCLQNVSGLLWQKSFHSFNFFVEIIFRWHIWSFWLRRMNNVSWILPFCTCE